MSPTISSEKTLTREKLNADIAAFLARGGEIQHIDSGVSAMEPGQKKKYGHEFKVKHADNA